MRHHSYGSVFQKVIKKSSSLINLVPKRLIVDFGNIQNTIFIAGSARSGTTWLAEIINYDQQYRFMFEPFHPNKVEAISDWKYFQYIRTDDDSDKYLQPMEKILAGKIRNKWIDRFNRRVITNKRIIKAVHANLFLHWMHEHFPDIPIVLILRHPCAVANSKINIAEKLFPHSNSPLNNFLHQSELMADYLKPYEKKMREVKTKFEKYIFMWCIENMIPLKQFQPGEIHATFYENLCLNPQDEFKRLFSFLGNGEQAIGLNKIVHPSLVSKKNSAIRSGKDLISSWREFISIDQINRAKEILHLFGLDILYNDQDLPLLSHEEALSRF